MKKYTAGQLKTLSDFLSNMALAWFVSGVIVPYFTPIDFYLKLFYNSIGLTFCYYLMKLALEISRFL